MSRYIGRLNRVGIAKETSRGVGVAPTFWLPVSQTDLDLKVQKARSDLAYGTIAGEGNVAPVATQWAEGEIKTDMFDKSFGLLLYAALGGVSTAGPTDSAYTHIFTIAETVTHQSLTIAYAEHDLGDIRFRMAMLSQLVLEISPEDAVKVSAKFVSKAPQDSDDTPTFAAENKFLGRHAHFKLATLASGLAAASEISINKMKLTINKSVIRHQVVGTGDPEDINNRGVTIQGEIELDLSDRTYRNFLRDGNYRAMRLQILNTDALIGAASYPTFTLDLSRVDFDPWEATRPNDNLATQKLTFHALFDITNGNVINSCTLKNTQASY